MSSGLFVWLMKKLNSMQMLEGPLLFELWLPQSLQN